MVKSVILTSEKAFDEFETMMTQETVKLQDKTEDASSKAEKNKKFLEKMHADVEKM